MNFFKNELLLKIPESYHNLAEWEKSADPSVRFENNYYTLQRLAFLHDYEEARTNNADPDDDKDADRLLHEQLDGLREMYIADLELLFELQMSMRNIFIPWRVRLQRPKEEM